MLERVARNIRIAFKSVFFHYRQYLCFFLALFAIQSIYGIVTVAYDNFINIEYRHVSEEYDYHLLLKDVNDDQYIYLINGGDAVLLSDQVYAITEVIKWDEEGAYNRRYDIYIKFIYKDPVSDYQRFKERFGSELASMSEDGSVRYTTTPILDFDNYRTVNTWSYIGITAALTLLAVFVMTALYSIRLNHYKYTYGVYMTFGADFGKLFETSFWEMILIAVASVIPASAFSAVFDFIVLKSRGEEFTFSVFAPFKILVFSLVITAIAVIYPIWRVSRRTPLSLIVAEDNSNMVISPRQSFELFGASYPQKYELFSLWRFRRYYAQLLLTAVVFTALFTAGSALTAYYKAERDALQPQFTLTFTNERYAYSYDGGEMKDELYAIEGVQGIYKEASVTAAEAKSFIVVPDSLTRAFSNLVVFDDESGYYVSDDLKYCAYDAEVAGLLEAYDYDGDLYAPLSDDNMIVISDSINDKTVFKYKVGDSVRLAVYTDKITDPPENLTGHELLKARMKYYYFDYVEFTVAAVIHDNPTFEYMPVYLTSASYSTVIGSSPEFRSVGVYVDPAASASAVSAVEIELRKWADIYQNVAVTNNHTASDYSIEYGKGIDAQLYACSLLIMLITPLVWFFSQTIFCSKRENEFYVLEMFGSSGENIRKIYIFDGLFCAAAGLLISLILSLAAAAVIYRLPYNIGIRHVFKLPALSFIAGLLLNMICGFLSAYVPYLMYINKRKRRSLAENDGERV